MMQIDQKIDDQRLAQFASQFEFIPPDVLRMLNECLLLDQDDEFYHGLMSGLAFAHQLVDQNSEGMEDAATKITMTMRTALAVLAKHLDDKRKMQKDLKRRKPTDGD